MSNIKLFQDKKIRSAWNDEEEQWCFSVVDVVEVLTDSVDPKQYIKRLRSSDEGLNLNWGTICTPIEMLALDGKKRKYKRLRGIAIRQNLTDEWKKRGVTEETDYAILTAEISKATFGLTPTQYKELKGLTKKNQNLRDRMNDLELIFTMLGERVTTEISEKEQPEKELGHSVVSKSNLLNISLKNKED